MVCSRYILVSLLIFPVLVNGKFLLFNPFKPNGFSLFYQLDTSISVLRVAGTIFIQILIVHSVSNKVATLIRRCVLGVHSLPMSN